MQEVKKGMESVMACDTFETVDEIFSPLARNWACYCLDHHTGELLEKGLAIAKALAEYRTVHEHGGE